MEMCIYDPPLFDNDTIDIIEFLEAFNRQYTLYHRWICAVVCTLGVILNILHIFVLTRHPMKIYAINNILSVVAVCDVITMSSYLLYIIRFKILERDGEVIGYPYYWLVFLMSHVVASIALHTVSLYLSVAMAFIRWNALDRLDSRWVKSRSIGWIFSLTTSCVTVISIPTLIVHRIVPVYELQDLVPPNAYEDILYTVTLDDLALRNGCTIFKLNLWLTGILFKAIPCVLLFCFTVALMRKLCEMSRKRSLLRGGDTRRKASIDKTTVMLIIMLTVFLCTELPQGALAILNAIYTTDVHAYVYINLGELVDLLSLVNCNVGFVLYCCMSSRYRATVRSTFFPHIEERKRGEAASAMYSLRNYLS